MRCHPDRPKRSGGNRGLQASEHDRTYAGASAPEPASREASIPTTMGAPSWRSPRERNIRGVVKVDCEFTPLEGSVSKSILSRGDSASAPFHWKTNAPEPFADALSSAHCGNR